MPSTARILHERLRDADAEGAAERDLEERVREEDDPEDEAEGRADRHQAHRGDRLDDLPDADATPIQP
ncbi:MAG: hypothetical protein KIT84_36370 [Labilithrix sp.]|nr:hypothetical protein [Labilithrix sp.]MCW5816531.1 hypothetical protein [Labilithrix sp.]